nr:PREDICTED: cytosolic phospholipase A2 zeta [Latimeria chalumnae]|eukprot:XP_006004632.2 PREDICTED: cytosolic phospholipase A2 zeta [Latimeria chalumnae]
MRISGVFPRLCARLSSLCAAVLTRSDRGSSERHSAATSQGGLLLQSITFFHPFFFFLSVSKADCYVEVRVPTASATTAVSDTVFNSCNPIWNNTFRYRLHDAVKNVLELSLYDKDVCVSDYLSSVVFDINNLQPGQRFLHTFTLNPEEAEELTVEFEVQDSKDPPGDVITNEVLVARPCLQVEGKIQASGNFDPTGRGENCFIVNINGAYEKEQILSSSTGESFTFHIDPDLDPKLNVSLQQTLLVLQDGMSSEVEKQTTILSSGCVPLNSLPVGQEVDMKVPLGKEQNVNITLKATECTEDLDVRLSFDLCSKEKEFLKKRSEVASRALQRALGLREAPDTSEVPVVAVVGSGGGTRAMTSVLGNLLGLQKLNLLDCVTYTCGVSGSAWGISTLYEDSDWSHKALQGAISRARAHVTKSKADAFSLARLKYYFQELLKKKLAGEVVSLPNLWGLIVEHFLGDEENQALLSEQQGAVQRGQNPYPIYASINVKADIDGREFSEWCEFTPYEVGFPKYGAFIQTEDFGSEFFMGRLMRRHQEPRICYLQGIWGSAFAASLEDIWSEVAGTGITWVNLLKDAVKVTDDRLSSSFLHPSQLKTRLIIPADTLAGILQEMIESRFTAGENFNFLWRLYLHRNYNLCNQFVIGKGNDLDAFPNQLTPMEASLYLVDGGFSNNSAFPLVLRPERKVDIILSFNYSWGSQFEVLKLAEKYCVERKIPFPKINLTGVEESALRECYMFVDEEDPRAPIVLHFPQVNNTFRRYKAPGVERQSEEEKSYGDFEIRASDSPYRTLNFSYTPWDFDRLVNLSHYNVENNKAAILKALQLAMDRKKLKQEVKD